MKFADGLRRDGMDVRGLDLSEKKAKDLSQRIL